MSEIKSDKCGTCGKTAYIKERIVADMKVFHANCFKCHHCNSKLTLGKYASMEGKYFCKPHFKQLFMSKGNYNEGFGTEKHSKNWEPQVAAGAFKGVETVLKADDKESKGSRIVPKEGESQARGSQDGAKQSKPEPFKLHVVIKEQGVEKQRLVLAC